MATFTDFSDLLPDPDNKIDSAGVSNASGSSGPGIASIKFSENMGVETSRTRSGRGLAASPNAHYWSFNIGYNPMTRSEFAPIRSFLAMRQGGMRPFFVILPQYAESQNATFASYVNSEGGSLGISASASAGDSSILIDVPAINGDPAIGDYFNIDDPTDSNHTKAYEVTRVETNDYYLIGSSQPTTTQRRVHFNPPLVRDVDSTASAVFENPKFRVRLTNNIFEHDLGVDNLYEFSLQVEEILP